MPALNIVMLLSNSFRPDPRPMKEAMALQEAGHRVQLYAWDRECRYPREELFQGISIRRIAMKGAYGKGLAQLPGFAWFWLQTFRKVMSNSVDVIHCHDLDTLPLGWLCAKLKRCRLVFDAHIPFPDRVSRLADRSRSTAAFVWMLRRLERSLGARADLLLTDSDLMVERFHELGIPGAKVILNVPPLDFIDPAKRPPPEGELTIVRIGLMSRSMGYGVDATLDAFEMLLDEGHNLKLVLAGNITPASYKEEIEARIADLGDRISFSEFIPYSQVMDWYQMGHISLVLYDLDKRGFNWRGNPTKLFEAFAACMPVVVCSNASINELVAKKQAGVLVDGSAESIATGLRTLILDPELRQTMGNAGRKLFEERYNWSIEAERLQHYYQTLA